jgi:hypothetical protein
MEEIIKNLLHLFNDSIGWEFRVKGSNLKDTIEGVNGKLQLVKGKKYGEFAPDLIELTGKGPGETKGTFNNECNRTGCERSPATFYHFSIKMYYCYICAGNINDGTRADAQRLYGHELCIHQEQPIINP